MSMKQVEDTRKVISQGLSSTVDALSTAARATKEFADKEETKAALGAVRDGAAASLKYAKEVPFRPVHACR